MDATIVPKLQKHYSVLLKEIISIITPQHGGTFIDCTFGQGGYSKEILKFNNTKVIALDRDLETKKNAEIIIKKFDSRFVFKNKKFSQLRDLKLKNQNIRGVIFDLGCSVNQIKDSKKGLSFNSKGNLNMRMGLNDFSADEVVNKLDLKELEKIFKFFGDDKDSKKIARNIIKERKKKRINTETLVKLIDRSRKKKNFKIHNSTKIFQALRIFVNKEVSELINGLIEATKILKTGGVLAVVTFHSLEDRIVKYFLKSLSEKQSVSRYIPELEFRDILFKLKEKKPITPSTQELKENIPSRSAKLRYAIKKKDFYNFETDIMTKFQHLIEIENFGNKL